MSSIFRNLLVLKRLRFLFFSSAAGMPGGEERCRAGKKLPRGMGGTGFFSGGAVRGGLLVIFSAIFCFAFFGCAGGKDSQRSGAVAPNPPHGRSADTAIKSQMAPSLSAPGKGAVSHDPNSGLPAAPFDWPPDFVRVAMLPIYTRVPTAGAVNDLDEIFRAELAKALPLEIVQISRSEMLAVVGAEQIESTSIVPQKLIQHLQAKHAVQGVVFTDMPLYRPYRPITIGVRSKLVHIPSMDIMWSADGILDSAEPGIAASAVTYALGNLKAPGKGAADVILQSPRRYAAFVAHGLYGTMPGQSPTPGQTNNPQYAPQPKP